MSFTGWHSSPLRFLKNVEGPTKNQPRPKPMRAVIYCRVSSAEQVQNYSLATQQKACAEYCEKHGFTVEKVYIEEGESAKTADRTEFQKLLTYCRQRKGQIHYVVVYSLSRFARSTHDHAVVSAHLKGFGTTLRSVTEPIGDSSSGRLMENMLAAFAQFDNDVRSERTVTGMKAAMMSGKWVFLAPLGYLQRPDGERKNVLVPDPDRASLVRKAFEMFATGVHTERAVLRAVTDLGLRTRKGAKVTPQTFEQLLRKRIYAGWLKVKGWGDEIRGNFEPIVSQETFDRVQAIFAGRRPRITPRLRSHPDFPLRCFVRCGTCNAPLTGSWSTGRSKRYAYYHCARPKCGCVNVRKQDLELAFTKLLARLQPDPAHLKLFNRIVCDLWNEKQAEAVTLTASLEARLEELKRRKQQLVDAFVHRQALDQATFEEQMDALKEETVLTEMKVNEAKIEELDVEGVLNYAEHLILNAERMWVESSHEQKQRLQKVLFPQGLAYRDGFIGTALKSLIFKLLSDENRGKNKMATPTGFEPVHSP